MTYTYTAGIRKILLTGLALLVVLAGWAIWAPATTWACSCVVPPPPLEAKADAAHVFSGTVKNIAPSGQQDLDVTIDVITVWKGSVGEEITVTTMDNSAACGFQFEVGNEYLVYTYEADDSVQVSLCSRTTLIDHAGEDLETLGEGAPVADGPTVVASSDANDDDNGLDMLALGGSIVAFAGLVVGITLLRRWK
jgi:hypothetical protein